MQIRAVREPGGRYTGASRLVGEAWARATGSVGGRRLSLSRLVWRHPLSLAATFALALLLALVLMPFPDGPDGADVGGGRLQNAAPAPRPASRIVELPASPLAAGYGLRLGE